MSIDVTAIDGDTLCGIAIAAGFLNCAPLRAEGANQAFLSRPLVAGDKVSVPDLNLKELSKSVDTKHVFRKKNAPPVSIRFVHGSPDKKYLEDDSLSVLHVSNFVTNKAGADGSKPFPKGFGFNPDGHADPDTFKVEIVDPGASGSIKAELEALKPVKQADGSILFQPITGVPDGNLRKIAALSVKQVNTGHVAFRSTYMRLVVDAEDHAAAAGQTLLTTDTVDAGDEALEILDQHVRATYEFGRCPGSPKCKVTAELGIGDPVLRAKVAVHVMIDPATGNPVATIDQTRKSVLKYVRQLYAQASMSVKLIGAIRTVPAPTNLIAIANGNGAPATGGTIEIRVRVGRLNAATFDFDQVVRIVTTPGTPPLTTATALATAINAAFAAASPPFAATATPSDNPPLRNQAIGSADVVVGNALTQGVSLAIVTNGDVGHRVTIGRLLTTTIVDFGVNDSHVGTIDERTLVKNYDTGTDRIDLFVVGRFGAGGVLGEAFPPHQNLPAARQPLALMTNTGLFRADTVNIKDHFHTTIPHELGHILMDENHEIVRTEMMVDGNQSLVQANERLINGPKRISDPPAPRTNDFDTGTKANPVTLLRTANTQVIE